MCGDPPNIIIGTALKYSFGDFLGNTGVMAGISLILVIVYFFLVYRKELLLEEAEAVNPQTFPEPAEAITNKKDSSLSCIICFCAVVLLVTH